jgi:hypothetical protein
MTRIDYNLPPPERTQGIEIRRIFLAMVCKCSKGASVSCATNKYCTEHNKHTTRP